VLSIKKGFWGCPLPQGMINFCILAQLKKYIMELQQKRFEKFFKQLKSKQKNEMAIAIYKTLSIKTINYLDRIIILQNSIYEKRKARNKKN
jgi:hypothetical protein